MKHDELCQHPAYLGLTEDEQAAVDERLAGWHLDAPAVAAIAGGVSELETEDLRFWLATTKQRPWAMISTVPQPQRCDGLFDAMLELAGPALAPREDRVELVDLARGLCRALLVAEGVRRDEGFIRDEQLAALVRRIERLAERVPEWEDQAIEGLCREQGLGPTADALHNYLRSHRGVRGFLQRVVERLDTKLFDFVHGGRLYVATGGSEHEGHYSGGRWSNWTDTYAVRPASFLRPRSEDELCRSIAGARRVRVVGAGHSFNDSPLCKERQISLDAYDRILELDRDARRVRVQAGIRLRDLNKALWGAGLGLPVLGSTDAQSLGGLVATDLHGTGRDHGFLSEQIRSLRVIDAEGEARTVRPGEELFHAAIGGLGACGVVAELELELVERYRLHKHTDKLERRELGARIEALLADNEHLSLHFIGGAGEEEPVRVHRWNRTGDPLSDNWHELEASGELRDFVSGARSNELDEGGPEGALVIPGGRAFGRKLSYRHDELEFGLPLDRYLPCLDALLGLLRDENFFSIVELRFTPDHSQALLGPGVGRATAYLGLATPQAQDHEAIYARIERLMLGYGGQPHLGKKTNMSAHDMLECFGERFARFGLVRAQQDPKGKFLNAFCERVLRE